MAGGSETYTFLTFASDNGYLLDQEMITEEPLETPGVDGVRFRTLHKQHTPTEALTVMSASAFGDAVILANNYRKAKGRLGTVTITAGSRTDSFAVHVVDVRPTPRVGPCIGASASSGSEAHVLCSWSFIPTDFDPSASA